MLGLPEPKPVAKPSDATTNARPEVPSGRVKSLSVAGIQLQHPDNWQPAVQGSNITIAPAGGAVQGGLAYGMIADVFKPQNARNLDQATAQFLQDLQKNNPAMKVVRSRVRAQVDGQTAQLTEATNDSPAGGQETDRIITVLRPNGELQYFVQVAPTKDWAQYQPAFQAIINSVRFR
jgi:hypothetical protein